MEKSVGIVQILKINKSEVTSCDFSRNNLMAIGSIDKTIHVLEWKVGLGFVDMYYSPLFSHKFGVTSVRFSPKGTMLVSSSLDGSAILHDVLAGKEIFIMVQPNKSSIRHCLFTPDCTKIITTSDDGLFCVWDLINRIQIRKWTHDEDFLIRGVSISPDSEYFVSADSKGLVQLWFIGSINKEEPECVSCLKNIHEDIYCCEFSPEKYISVKQISTLECKYFLATSGSESEITIWSVVVDRSLEAEHTEFSANFSKFHVLNGHNGDVLSVRFDSKGNQLASTGLDNTVKLWEVSSGKCLQTFEGHTRFGTCSAFSKDSELLATGSNDKTVIIWALIPTVTLNVSISQRCDISTHFINNYLIKFTSAHSVIDQGSEHINKMKLIQTISFPSAVYCVHFNGDNTLITVGGERIVNIWKKQNEEFFHETDDKSQKHKHTIYHLEISSCGTKVIYCSEDGTVMFWNLEIGLTYELKNSICTGGLRICRFSPNSELIATGGDDQVVFIWNVNTLEFVRAVQNHRDTITSVAFTPDSKFLASCCSAGDLALYDFEKNCSSVIVNNAHDLGATSCDFSSALFPKDSTFKGSSSEDELNSNVCEEYLLATSGNDCFVKLWKVSTLEIKIFRVLSGHGASISYVRFSYSEPFIVASCSTDNTVRIWHAETGQCFHALNFHHNIVTTCSFSKNSSLLATGSLDKTVLIWFLPRQFYSRQLSVIRSIEQPIHYWTSSNFASWFFNMGYPDIAEKIKLSSLNGIQFLSNENNLALNMTEYGNEAEQREMKLLLYWLKKEILENISTVTLEKKNVPHQFLCPITHEIMKNPIICSDGYTYEKEVISEWLLKGEIISPVTKEPLSDIRFWSNSILKANICKYLYGEELEN